MTEVLPKPWFVYLVRAANGALYCGISDDPQRRFAQHQSGKGARFFHASPARALVYVETCVDKRAALRRELSPRHVPDAIDEVPAIPRTMTGKKLEKPIKQILLGRNAGGDETLLQR